MGYAARSPRRDELPTLCHEPRSVDCDDASRHVVTDRSNRRYRALTDVRRHHAREWALYRFKGRAVQSIVAPLIAVVFSCGGRTDGGGAADHPEAAASGTGGEGASHDSNAGGGTTGAGGSGAATDASLGNDDGANNSGAGGAGGSGAAAGASGGMAPGAGGMGSGGTITVPPSGGVDASLGGGGMVPCPATPPDGDCDIDQQICSYSTGTCACNAGAWSCEACPAAQPANGSVCADDSTVSPRTCVYGSVTCACPLGDSTWNCGICPATKPTSQQPCGNAPFACAYGGDNCSCTPQGWQCSTMACPKAPNSGPIACSGVFTCSYPAEGQICACRGYWSCGCPAMRPTNGGPCNGNIIVGDTAGMCAYDDVVCTCPSQQWSCAASCPTAPPTDGTTCSTMLSCSYESALCACDGAAWHCAAQ
jgi:hypothetical protein